MSIPCVILCGGKSSRMQKNKALLPFKDTTLLQYQYQKMQSIFKEVYIAIKTPFKFYDFPSITDENKEIFTPLLALQSSFLKLDSKKIFFICVDTPLIPEQIIRDFIHFSQTQPSDITYIKTNQKEHYLTSIWDKNTLPLIQKALHEKNYKIRNIFNQCSTTPFLHNNENDLLNLNTPQDYNFLKEYNG